MAVTPELRGQLLQEVLDEQRDVVASLAKCWELDRNDIQPVVEIFAKRPFTDHLREVRVRSGDHADINLDRMRVADAFDLAFLEHAQELGLQPRAHRPDLVEEERAFVRLLEPSLSVGDCAREGAAHVAEELSLEEGFRDRAAVDREKPLGASGAVVVNRLGRQLLAVLGLAGDEHRARRARDDLQQPNKSRITRLRPTSPSIR